MSHIEELAVELLQSLDCPYDTDGSIESRKANMMKILVATRVSSGIESSNDLLDNVIHQVETESMDQGVRALRKYIKEVHNSLVSNIELHSKIVYKLNTES